MAGERGLIRKVRLLLDRRSADKTAKDSQNALRKGTDPKKAEKNLSRIDKGFGRLRATALKLGAAIGVAFAGRAMLRFGRDAVRVAAEAGAIWTRLAGTLQTVGVNLDDVRGEIESTARAMQDASTVGDEDFAQILQGLVVVSGDYTGSLRNVQLVADLAAGTQMDFVAASRLVGRAMIGDTATLKRYGIVVGEGEDAIAAMRRQFKGLAENEANSLQGRLKQITNEWSDFKQAVGEAMTGGGSDGGLIAIRNAIRDVTQAINDNQSAVASFGTAFADATRTVISIGTALATADGWLRRYNRGVDEFVAKYGLTAAARKKARDSLRAALREDEEDPFSGRPGTTPLPPPPPPSDDTADPNKALRDRITLLGKASDLNVLTSEQIHEILRLEQDTRDEIARGNLSLERRVELEERLATLGEMSQGLVGQLGAPEIGLAGTSIFTGGAPGKVSSHFARHREHIEFLTTVYRDGFADIESAATNAAWGVAGAWQDAFALIGQEGATVGKFMETLLRGMAAAGVGGLADFASSKIAENIALFFDNTAKAQAAAASALVGNPLGPAAAAMYGAAAKGNLASVAKWAVLAGGAGAAQGALGGGGRGGLSGGVPTGARDIGGRIADRQASAPEIHIYVDGIDPSNSQHQRLVGATAQNARDRWGPNSRITVHPRNGGG